MCSASTDSPVLTQFQPNSKVHSVDFIEDTASWRIIMSYDSSQPWGSIHVPILFFPTPGNGLLEAKDHPCIINHSPCCLLDFVEQYTTVALYTKLLEMRDILNRQTCNSITDLRPIIEILSTVSTTTVNPPSESTILGALNNIPETSIELIPTVSSPTEPADSYRLVYFPAILQKPELVFLAP